MIGSRRARELVVVLLSVVASLSAGASAGAQDGSLRILEAGKLDWSIRRQFDGPTVEGGEPSVREVAAPGVGPVRCSSEKWTIERVREATEVTTFAPDSIVYPGAILQGGRLQEDQFAPVAIPRAGATLTISNVEVPNPNATVPVMSFDHFQAARRQLLEGIEGTAAALNYFVQQVYDEHQSSAFLGVVGQFGPFSGSASFDFSGREESNYVLLTFFQKFYTISFPAPPTPASVFDGGEHFVDAKNQIGPGNPPLYVQSVHYGRQILFLVQSSYSAQDVAATMEAAYRGAAASVEVRGGLDHREIMSQSRVSYYVRGGAAADAVQPVQAATPAQMYDSVRTLIASRKSAEYSRDNPGVPIQFNLNYLVDDTPATVGVSANYDRNDCEVISEFEIEFTNVDDGVYLLVNGGVQYVWDALANENPNPARFDLNPLLADGDNTVVIRLGNNGCFVSSLNFDLFKGNSKVHSKGYHSGGWSHCGWQLEWHYTINRQTGRWEFLSKPSWPD